MRRFCVYKRNGQETYYAQIKNPETGKYLPARSTGTTDKSEAYVIVSDWLHNGIPEKSSKSNKRPLEEIYTLDTIINVLNSIKLSSQDAMRITSVLQNKGVIGNVALKKEQKADTFLFPFLEEFWDYENSPYVREKHAYGQSIGKRHCYEQTKRLSHWKKFFDSDTRLTDVTKEDLRNFQLALKDKDLAPKTINMILTVGTVPFGWAAEREEIAANPAEGLRKFSGASKKRDILTLDEVQKIFSLPWDEERARVGNLLAMTTGLRAGEVIALRYDDIQGDKLMVRHSWSFADGLKAPKNGDERVVPLIPQIKQELMKLLDKSPYGKRGFIFYGTKPDKPMNIDVLSKGLTKAYISMNLPASKKNRSKESEAIRKAMVDRGICFHSWRHFYATHLADKIELRTVQLATGHKTSAMAAHYADHAQGSHLDQVSRAVNDVFNEMMKPEGISA
jgi:integrase